MGVKVTNNAFGTLSASINTTDTTVTLDTGQGARFPTLGASDYFYGTIVDTSNNIEIVKVTARSTDSMTVTRAQDNTTARSFAIGDRFELRPTAALFEDILAGAEVVNDTTPQLGGNLDLNSNNINDGTFLADSSRIRVPNSSSAPSSPNEGDMYYDTDDDAIFHWDGSSWTQMSNKFAASGGTETTYTSGSTNYKVHSFTSSGTFTVNSGSKSVDYLVVAAGGGGRDHNSTTSTGGGGGGAGGMLTGTTSVNEGSYTITVGAGSNQAKGGNSSFGSIATALGGGQGGARTNLYATDGGSGGGEGFDDSSPGSGTSGQGNNGGTNNGSTDYYWPGGGGGGKGAVGGNAAAQTAGAGGVGAQNAIRTGSNVYYAGGGGGAVGDNGTSGGSGGSGGGGTGGYGSGSGAVATDGSANTGGGGGGAGSTASGDNGSAGGSGIVVIRYEV